jgi:hypothetical protein
VVGAPEYVVVDDDEVPGDGVALVGHELVDALGVGHGQRQRARRRQQGRRQRYHQQHRRRPPPRHGRMRQQQCSPQGEIRDQQCSLRKWRRWRWAGEVRSCTAGTGRETGRGHGGEMGSGGSACFCDEGRCESRNAKLVRAAIGSRYLWPNRTETYSRSAGDGSPPFQIHQNHDVSFRSTVPHGYCFSPADVAVYIIRLVQVGLLTFSCYVDG